MKPSELRIGNWINTIEGPAQVREITDYERLAVGTDKRVVDLQTAGPIRLNKKILLSCGFMTVAAKNDSVTNRYSIKTFVRDENGCERYGSCKNLYLTEQWGAHFFEQFKRGPINFVHQLQNLYFALTGQELEINL